MDKHGWDREKHWGTTELASDLSMCQPNARVQATTPHESYLFNIVGLKFDEDGGITLMLEEAPK